MTYFCYIKLFGVVQYIVISDNGVRNFIIYENYKVLETSH